MSEALYNTAILRLAASIPHQQRLSAPQASVVKVSPVCGSRVTVDVELGPDGRVARFGQEVRACALGQAAASLFGAHVIGRSPAELVAARDAAIGAQFDIDGDTAAAHRRDLDHAGLRRG